MTPSFHSPAPALLRRSVLALAVATLLGGGCASAPSSRFAPSPPLAPISVETTAITRINTALAAAALQAPEVSGDYLVAPEDLLEITLFNMPETRLGVTPRNNTVRVSQAGVIALPLLGDVPAAGLTVSDLEQSLRERYDRYFHHPQVGVQVKDYRGQRISVIGAVRQPGVFPLTGPKTLIDLVALAGGLSEGAGKQVYIYRKGPEGRQSYVVDLLTLAHHPGLVNMSVQAGDVINVPQAGMFFVDGAVAKPGSYPLAQPYTLTQALTVAGGVTRTLASYSGVAIFRRRVGADSEKIPVDLSEIWASRASDPQIEADDVIVVPINSAKFFVHRFIGGIGLPGIPTPY
jgi:polysaccharide export outer membrane protein